MGSSWRFPRVIAHRGGGRLAPENTLAAMRCGMENGYRAVEFDVKLSADNHCFLLHDDLLDRTTSGHGAAAVQPWRSLSTLDAGSWFGPSFAGEKLPELAAVADYCLQHQLFANVEIKPCPERGVETGALVAEAVERLWEGARDKVLLSSFSLEALAAARKHAPYLPRGVLFEGIPANWREIATGLGCVSVNVDAESLTEQLAAEIRAAGFRLLVFTVNDPAVAERLFGWGVDGVFTDALPELKAFDTL
jgi:glycerophosphoryl diester phosphodiesterase